MKKTLTFILLFILTLSMLLCSCDKNPQNNEEEEIIAKVEIRYAESVATVVYEDGYELSYPLTQPVEVFLEKSGARAARAIGISSNFFVINGFDNVVGGSGMAVDGNFVYATGGDFTYVAGTNIVFGTAGEGTVTGDYVFSTVVQKNYIEIDGKKYENCSAELLTYFRANTVLIDLVSGFEEEPFETIYTAGFTKFEKLEAIVLPKTITKVGKRAFDECPNLVTVFYGGTAEEWLQVELEGSEMKDKDDKEVTGMEENVLTRCIIYFYSEEQPEIEGQYWHYVNGEIVAW